MDLVEELTRRGLDRPEAEALARALALMPEHLAPAVLWRRAGRTLLRQSMPLAVHQFVHQRVFAGWTESVDGPRPVWQPTDDEIAGTNIAALMREKNFADYPALVRWSIADREGFWKHAVARLPLRFAVPPIRVLDAAGGPEHPRWLPGARYNIVDGCFAADPGAPAILAGGPGRANTATSYRELARATARVAHALQAAGFGRGDALAIDMPMTAHAVEIYLGIVMAGMVVVSIADALAADEIATRLRIANTAGIFTAYEIDRGGKRLPLYRKVLDASPRRVIVLDAGTAALRPEDETWEVFLSRAATDDCAAFDSIPGEPDDTTNLLFSSGTTGDPKAIPWTHLTPIKAATDGALHLDIHPGDVVAWPTNLGWMMGPWLIYAALLNRATIALYDDAPTGRDFGRFAAEARVTVLGLVPSIVKAWRSDDRMIGLDWSAIRCFGSTGEVSNAEDYHYLMMLAGYRPVVEYCGGTEIGGGYITGTLVQPAAPATFSTPALGSSFVLLDESGKPTDNGEVFLVPPTLGYSQRLQNRDHHEVYFAGTPPGPGGEVLRRHGDQIERLPGGYFRAHGRVDDTMNLGGIKVSSAEIERVLDAVAGVKRTAAIAVSPPGGGPSLLVIYVETSPTTGGAGHGAASGDDGALKARLQDAIKHKLNPLFRIHDLVRIDALPVTASNKIMRRELRARYGHG